MMNIPFTYLLLLLQHSIKMPKKIGIDEECITNRSSNNKYYIIFFFLVLLPLLLLLHKTTKNTTYYKQHNILQEFVGSKALEGVVGVVGGSGSSGSNCSSGHGDGLKIWLKVSA